MSDSDEDWGDESVLDIYKKQLKERLARKDRNRKVKSWPEEAALKKLDTNIRKNSAFVKAKLESLRENQRKALETEFHKLNLVRYKQEAVATLTTSKYRVVDVSLAVFICELFHHRFEDFRELLCDAWKAIFGKYRQIITEHKKLEKKKPENVNTVPTALDTAKIRLDIKFIAELTCLDILPMKSGLGLLHYIFSQFVIENEGKQKEFLPLMITLCKSVGDDIFGLVPRARKDDMEKSTLIAPEKQKLFNDILKKYYQWLIALLQAKHKELQRQERRNLKMLTDIKGELSDKRKEQTRELHEDYQFWLEKITSISDLLDVKLPDFDEVEKAEESTVGIEIVIEKVKNRGDLGVWEDEDQKVFYTSIKSLKDSIPGNLWQQSSNIHRDPEKSRKRRRGRNSGPGKTAKPSLGKDRLDGDLFDYMDDFYEFDSDEEMDLETTKPDPDELNPETLTFQTWLIKLNECYNRDLVDTSAENFCLGLNTPSNRKKLIQHIGTIARARMDLIPFNCRLICTLMPLMPHVGEDIIAIALSTFRFFMRKRENINVSSKLKVAKYISELTKFELIDRTITLGCLNVLITDFRAHSIEMLSAILNGCGRFLYLQEDSHRRLKILLEKLERLKLVKLPEYKYKAVIDNALLATIPQDEDDDSCDVVKQPPRHPIILFAEHLILHELGNIENSGESEADNCNRIIRILRKFPLKQMTPAAEKQFLDSLEPEKKQEDAAADEGSDASGEKSRKPSGEEGPPLPTMAEIREHVMLLLSSGYKVRFSNLPYLANVVAGLNTYYETIGVEVADAVLEDIRRGMEIAHPQFNQRRVSQVKYLAELYNYRIVNSAVIFKTAYSFITFGTRPFGVELLTWIANVTQSYGKLYDEYDVSHPPPEAPSDSEDDEDDGMGANAQFNRDYDKWLAAKHKYIASTRHGKGYANVLQALHHIQHQMQVGQVDKPDDLFRLRLVCSLLDTCGGFFSKGGARKKLDYFLDYFQYYVISKRLLPTWRLDLGGQEWPKHYDYLLSDTILPLRPKFIFCNTVDDVPGLISRIQMIEKEMSGDLSGRAVSTTPVVTTKPGAPARSALDNIREEDDMQNDSSTPCSEDNAGEESESEEIDSEEEEQIRVAEEKRQEEMEAAREEARRKHEEERKRQNDLKQRKEEDEAFDSMFNNMIKQEVIEEELAKRTNQYTVASQVNNLPAKLNKSILPEQSQSTVENFSAESFSLMTKGKSNRPQFAAVNIGSDEAMMARIQEQRYRRHEEQTALKLKTLELYDDIKEEEEREELAAMRAMNPKYKKKKEKHGNDNPTVTVKFDEEAQPLHFDRAGNYKHQQGVPQNLNDIFGSNF